MTFMTTEQRGTGRTSLAMIRAPQGAIYVWPNGNLTAPKLLARNLGRPDIVVVSPAFLTEENAYRQRDRRVVLDHATNRAWQMPEGQREAIKVLRARGLLVEQRTAHNVNNLP